jgi:hypothetical protein
MKLARKLILSMVIGLTLVLAANSFYRVRRELAAFDDDMKQDHEVLAQVLEKRGHRRVGQPGARRRPCG